MGSIFFFTEETDFPLENENNTRKWVEEIIKLHGEDIDSINFIFCSDSYLLKINQQYLSHDYYTDIITFDNREPSDHALSSDIYISTDRIKENSKNLGVSFRSELHRVIIHGILHLLGWKDKNEHEKNLMREKEEACLSLLNH